MHRIGLFGQFDAAVCAMPGAAVSATAAAAIP
jgi:hypothetical protein